MAKSSLSSRLSSLINDSMSEVLSSEFAKTPKGKVVCNVFISLLMASNDYLSFYEHSKVESAPAAESVES